MLSFFTFTIFFYKKSYTFCNFLYSNAAIFSHYQRAIANDQARRNPDPIGDNTNKKI